MSNTEIMANEKVENHSLAVEDTETNELDDIPRPGCGILGRNPIISVLCFAALGIGMGIGLSYWEPEDDSKDLTLRWLGLIGDLFIRALKAIILPLVFINVVLSVVDMCTVGKVGSIGWKTIATYLMTTVLAGTIGILSSAVFRPLFSKADYEIQGPAEVTLACDNEGSFLAEFPDGNVSCTSDLEGTGADNIFIIDDISGTFVRQGSGLADQITLSDTVYDGVFMKLITDNIFGAFADTNFAAVVVFAIAFGIALCQVYDRKKLDYEHGQVMSLFKEVDGVLLMLIRWIIKITPFAVWSLIVSAVGGQDDLAKSFANVGWLVIATMVGMGFHYTIVYSGLLYIVTRKNPFTYLRQYLPAQTMAFACASSAATIPVTMSCAKSTGLIPEPIARFVIPLGATVNMDGSAIYFPVACVWLAVLNGVDVNVGHYILLVIVASIGSIGTAPVPSAGLVLIITAYNTVFGTSGTPDGFEYVFAIDWFTDRLQTALNVSGDGVVARCVSEWCPIDELLHHEVDAQKEGSASESADASDDAEDSKPVNA